MSVNQCYARGENLTVAAPIAANSGVGPISGDPLMLGYTAGYTGRIACVAETSYTPPGSLTATGNIAVKDVGVYFLSVTAKTSLSPSSSAAMHPGDRVYADGGTLDTTTGILYGFTLDGNSTTGVYFGNTLDAVTSGATAVVRVRLKVAG